MITVLTNEDLLLTMNRVPMYEDDTDGAHYLRMGRAVEEAVSAVAMATVLQLVRRRLQADIDDGTRPDQWAMEALVAEIANVLPELQEVTE